MTQIILWCEHLACEPRKNPPARGEAMKGAREGGEGEHSLSFPDPPTAARFLFCGRLSCEFARLFQMESFLAGWWPSKSKHFNTISVANYPIALLTFDIIQNKCVKSHILRDSHMRRSILLHLSSEIWHKHITCISYLLSTPTIEKAWNHQSEATHRIQKFFPTLLNMNSPKNTSRKLTKTLVCVNNRRQTKWNSLKPICRDKYIVQHRSSFPLLQTKKAKKNQASVPRLWSVLVTESKKEKTIQTLKLSIQQKFFLMIFTNNQ